MPGSPQRARRVQPAARHCTNLTLTCPGCLCEAQCTARRWSVSAPPFASGVGYGGPNDAIVVHPSCWHLAPRPACASSCGVLAARAGRDVPLVLEHPTCGRAFKRLLPKIASSARSPPNISSIAPSSSSSAAKASARASACAQCKCLSACANANVHVEADATPDGIGVNRTSYGTLRAVEARSTDQRHGERRRRAFTGRAGSTAQLERSHVVKRTCTAPALEPDHSGSVRYEPSARFTLRRGYIASRALRGPERRTVACACGGCGSPAVSPGLAVGEQEQEHRASPRQARLPCFGRIANTHSQKRCMSSCVNPAGFTAAAMRRSDREVEFGELTRYHR